MDMTSLTSLPANCDHLNKFLYYQTNTYYLTKAQYYLNLVYVIYLIVCSEKNAREIPSLFFGSR